MKTDTIMSTIRMERVFDPVEGVLTEISDPNVILEAITSQKSYRVSNQQRKKLLQKI